MKGGLHARIYHAFLVLVSYAFADLTACNPTMVPPRLKITDKHSYEVISCQSDTTIGMMTVFWYLLTLAVDSSTATKLLTGLIRPTRIPVLLRIHCVK